MVEAGLAAADAAVVVLVVDVLVVDAVAGAAAGEVCHTRAMLWDWNVALLSILPITCAVGAVHSGWKRGARGKVLAGGVLGASLGAGLFILLFAAVNADL